MNRVWFRYAVCAVIIAIVLAASACSLSPSLDTERVTYRDEFLTLVDINDATS